jgi:DNA-binding phage protein
MVRPMLTAEERARGQRLGALLRQARGDRSMVEVAAQATVPVETLRKIETGRIPTPAFFTVVALADAVGLNLSSLCAALGSVTTRDGDPARTALSA